MTGVKPESINVYAFLEKNTAGVSLKFQPVRGNLFTPILETMHGKRVKEDLQWRLCIMKKIAI